MTERQARLEGFIEHFGWTFDSIDRRLAGVETLQRWVVGIVLAGVLGLAGLILQGSWIGQHVSPFNRLVRLL